MWSAYYVELEWHTWQVTRRQCLRLQRGCRACRRAARLRLHLNVGALRISFVLLSKGDAAVWFGSIEEGGGAGIFGMLGAEGGGNQG